MAHANRTRKVTPFVHNMLDAARAEFTDEAWQTITDIGQGDPDVVLLEVFEHLSPKRGNLFAERVIHRVAQVVNIVVGGIDYMAETNGFRLSEAQRLDLIGWMIGVHKRWEAREA